MPNPTATSADAPVLMQEIPLGTAQKFRLGRLTLNRPTALNALNLDMIEILLQQLQAWSNDPSIVMVWLEGAGDRAFCAGGDVVEVYLSMARNGAEINQHAVDYFSREYRLDHLIHTYRKPLVCWGQGVVMGGGLGLLAGAGYRVVTDQSRLAMPEITIGLFPDVGGSWFLNRMPGHTGRFAALTGAQLNAADALFAGLADRYIAHDQKAKVLHALRNASWNGEEAQDHLTVDRLLREFAQLSSRTKPMAESNLRQHFDRINQLVDHPTLAETVYAISGLRDDDPWLQKAAQTLQHGSPSSAYVIDRQLRQTRTASLVEVFQQELNLAVACCHLGEFQEGVRALLVDKDKAPQWQFPDIASVEPAFVEAHFDTALNPNPLQDLSRSTK
ncbi:MAG: enoyl-CoA hydratase/isomerase family protein [Natronospirillum sp.]